VLGYFFWMMAMLMLADTFYSLFFVNWQAMFAEKYRGDEARRRGNVYKLVLAIASVIIGNLLPVEIYEWGDLQSFAMMGAVIFLIGSVAGILVIYGAREDPARKAQQIQEGAMEREKFVQSFKTAFNEGLHNKAFIGYIFLYFGNKVWDLFVLGSVPYYAKWILGVDPSDLFIPLALVIIGIFAAVPIFTKVSEKVGFYKAAIIGGLTESLCTIPLIFIRDINVAYIFFFIVGIGNGAMWTALSPTLAQALDSLAIQMGKRESGVFSGIYAFFGRFAIIIFTVGVVGLHAVTGFNADAPPGQGMQTALADLGIVIQIGLIPVLATAIFTVLFALTFDIKGEKKEWLDQQLREKDLLK
jgi:GPH family glycoside/pentoside/hexuronide:cation symporter